jgi:amino acid transporter
MMMAYNGMTSRWMSRTHNRNSTPHTAVLVTGLATLLLPVGLTLAKTSDEAIYDWMGSLATYGFITVYALVAVALPLHLKAERKLSAAVVVLATASVLAMVLVLEGTLYPVPEAPKNWLPYLFLAYLAAGILWREWQTHGGRQQAAETAGGLEPISDAAETD